ncbi:hypothetical protein D3C75_491820 [compost metagenome]
MRDRLKPRKAQTQVQQLDFLRLRVSVYSTIHDTPPLLSSENLVPHAAIKAHCLYSHFLHYSRQKPGPYYEVLIREVLIREKLREQQAWQTGYARMPRGFPAASAVVVLPPFLPAAGDFHFAVAARSTRPGR